MIDSQLDWCRKYIKNKMHEKFIDKSSLNREMYAFERLDEEDPIQLVNE